jgi:hypothetical protein
MIRKWGYLLGVFFINLAEIFNIIKPTTMKKVLFFSISLAFFFSCSNAEKAEPAVETVAVETPAPAPTVNYPFESSLASDFKMGNPEYTVKVMEMYKILEKGEHIDSLLLPYFADSVTSVSFDMREFRGPSTEFVKRVKAFRSQFKTVNEEFITFASLRSDAKDLNLVSVWFKERVVRNNGKADSTLYQENWRLNDDGKIYYRTAFARYGF